MRKLFSLIAAVLFAGSMMAEVTITPANSGWSSTGEEQTGTVEGVTIAVTKGLASEGQDPDQLRIYKDATLTISAESNITKIEFTCTANGTTKYGPGCFGEQEGYSYEGNVGTWTGSSKSVSFTASSAQVRATQIVVTLDDGGEITPPAPTMNYYLTGSMTNWGPDAAYMLTPANGGLYKGEFTFAANDAFKITYSDGTSIEDSNWFPGGMGNDYTIAEDGDYAITFNPAGGVEGWYEGYFLVEKQEAPVLIDPTNCAEAAEAALSVSANNELYNGGKEYTITGYVTSIKTAYNDQYHNISFWMADTKDGGEVLQAYRAACASEEDAPAVGAKVSVTGKLTKFNSTPEFAAGCTFVIEESGEGGETPEQTVAEKLTQLIADAKLIRAYIAKFDESAAAQMDPYITAAEYLLATGNEDLMNQGLAEAEAKVKEYINSALSMGKEALIAQLQGLALATDDEACQKIIADAVAFVQAVEWNDLLSVAANISDLEKKATDLYNETMAKLDEARNPVDPGTSKSVTIIVEDYAATEFNASGISVSTAKNDGTTAPVYNATGKDLRVYAKGSITISAETSITAISFEISTQGKKRLAPLTANVGEVEVKGDPDFTAVWTGSATEVTITVGEKADYGTDGSSKAGQLDFTAITVTLGEGGDTPVEPTAEYFLVGNFNGWQANAAYKFVANAANEGEFMLTGVELAADDSLKVIGVLDETTTWYPDGKPNYVIAEDGEYDIYFRPEGGVEGWYEGVFYVAKVEPVVLPDPTNCAEAREAALSVSANNEEYNGGKVYTITGFVTEIAYAYDATKGNMSFWMADTKDGGKVLEAYKCTITGAENAPEVGDKVAVTGKLTKYNSTPEFAAGCTVEIIEKAGGEGGEGGEGDEVVLDVAFAEAAYYADYSAWQLNLYKDYNEETYEVTYPDLYIGFAAKSGTAIAGTYAAADLVFAQVFTSENDSAEATSYATDLVIEHQGDGVYNVKLNFVGDDNVTYVVDWTGEVAAYDGDTYEDIVLDEDGGQGGEGGEGGEGGDTSEVIFTREDFIGQGTANTGSEVTATKSGVTFTYSKGYCADESLRCYAKGSLSITANATIEKIVFTTTGGKTGGLDPEVEVNATSYEVASLASQARFTEIKVILNGGATGIEETLSEGKAVKVLREGQVLIMKGDRIYTPMGQVVK